MVSVSWDGVPLGREQPYVIREKIMFTISIPNTKHINNAKVEQFLCSRIHHSEPGISILGASILKSL